MSYLQDFKYDIFLSYAHLDNKTTDNKEGWITKFYKQFKLELDRYLESTNTASVWCDHELRANYAFDDRIRNVIDSSALFLAFTSNAFYRSEYCCDKELDHFYKKALKHPLGIKVNDSRRIFNIQLLNKHYSSWPEPLQGGGRYELFKPSNPNSLNRDNDQGITLDPESAEDRDIYKKRIVEIVQDVCATLIEIKKSTTRVTPVASTGKQVFFGKVADTLVQVKNQVVTELARHNIIVSSEKIPPPYDKDGHAKKVSDKLSNTELAVYMFDNIPGDAISDDYPYSFSREQFMIGQQMNKYQLVFIPQELVFEKIEDRDHGDFLSELLTKKTNDSKYSLIRELSVPAIVEHIKDRLSRPDPVPAAEGSILLDYNETDFTNVIDYYNSLQKENKKIYLAKPGKGPLESISGYEKALQEVTTVIIYCCTVAKDWLLERINEIRCAIKTGKSSINKLMVYNNSAMEDLSWIIRN